MLKLIIFSIAVVATCSGEVVEIDKDLVEENVNVPNVEQKSSFPVAGSIQQQNGNGIVNFPPFTGVKFPSANSGIIPSGINNPINFSPCYGIIPQFFNNYNPSLSGIIPPFYNGIYNSFLPYNNFVPPFFNGLIPPYFNGIISPFFCSPSKFPYNHPVEIPPYYNPIYPSFYPYTPNTAGVRPSGGVGGALWPNQVNNNVEAVVDHNIAHIEHKPEIVSSISETVSNTLPHGETVVKETKEFSTNLNEGFHPHHEPAVVKTVSQVVSESLPHVGKVVKETKEFITHGDRDFHGHGYGHRYGGY
ncbi:uncharacterized protein [Leptinotarsa decemlineata]|uniref:uncharacterized protein n=1 Tax=Leptinotarsa decemlineata TaxID=7539 RepID=UPI003D30B348